MSSQQIEQRLARLESRVSELQAELAAAKRRSKDWRKTIGAFTNDAGMQEILKGAMQLREEDRKRSRTKKSPKRKPRSRSFSTRITSRSSPIPDTRCISN